MEVCIDEPRKNRQRRRIERLGIGAVLGAVLGFLALGRTAVDTSVTRSPRIVIAVKPSAYRRSPSKKRLVFRVQFTIVAMGSEAGAQLDTVSRGLDQEADARDADAERRRDVLRVGAGIRDVPAPEVGAPVRRLDAEPRIQILLRILDVHVVDLPVFAPVKLAVNPTVPLQLAHEWCAVLGAQCRIPGRQGTGCSCRRTAGTRRAA